MTTLPGCMTHIAAYMLVHGYAANILMHQMLGQL